MGIRLFGSRCSCDAPAAPQVKPAPGQPQTRGWTGWTIDARDFTVLRTQAVGSALVAEVQYEGCSNYEGRKVLVYENMSNVELMRIMPLDPHFCEDPKCVSPVARFEPTPRGWSLALTTAAVVARGGQKNK